MRLHHAPNCSHLMRAAVRRGGVFLICVTPWVMMATVLIPAVGGETSLIHLSRLFTLGLLVAFLWWVVRPPIMATAGLMLAGLIWWSGQYGGTPEAWSGGLEAVTQAVSSPAAGVSGNGHRPEALWNRVHL